MDQHGFSDYSRMKEQVRLCSLVADQNNHVQNHSLQSLLFLSLLNICLTVNMYKAHHISNITNKKKVSVREDFNELIWKKVTSNIGLALKSGISYSQTVSAIYLLFRIEADL